MKTTFFIVALLTATVCFSQVELPTKDGKVYYELIDSSVKASADQLYTRSKIWFTNTFQSAKEVIQLDDKENHTVVGKGNFQFSQGIMMYACWFTVKIVAKNNKYRAQFYDVKITSGLMTMDESAESYNNRKGLDKVKTKVNEKMQQLLAGIKKEMNISVKDNDF